MGTATEAGNSPDNVARPSVVDCDGMRISRLRSSSLVACAKSFRRMLATQAIEFGQRSHTAFTHIKQATRNVHSVTTGPGKIFGTAGCMLGILISHKQHWYKKEALVHEHCAHSTLLLFVVFKRLTLR